MLSVFSTALVADVGVGRCSLFYQIKLVLINCIYKYCTFLHKCIGCFLKLLMVLMFQTDQRETLFASLYFITVSERSSHWQCFSKPLSHKPSRWMFVLKIFEKYLRRSSILLKLHACNLELYYKLNYLISIFQLLLVQVQASILWNTFWWQLLSLIPNQNLKCF